MTASADAGLLFSGTFWTASAKPGLATMLRKNRTCGVVA